MKITKSKLREIIREEIQSLSEYNDLKSDKFELGTPVVYKDKGYTYSGEVVMNKERKVKINGTIHTFGKETIKGIHDYKSNVFIVPDDWHKVKKF